MLGKDIYYMKENEITTARVVGTRLQKLTKHSTEAEEVMLELEGGKILHKAEACETIDALYKQLNKAFRRKYNKGETA